MCGDLLDHTDTTRAADELLIFTNHLVLTARKHIINSYTIIDYITKCN